jgi:hypothetical protein
MRQAGFALGAAGSVPAAPDSAHDWVAGARILIAEGYNAPFYPALAYDPERALSIAKRLNANGFRFPAAAYYAFYPTQTKYPVHPELRDRDLLGATVDLFHRAGLKVVAYVPLNHPFMDVNDRRPDYLDWTKRFADGSPMITPHFGYTTYYEGCLNSSVRQVIQEMVREVLTQYPVDVMYFDGPYMGMRNSAQFCHCRSCEAAYRAAKGKPVPRQDRNIPPDDLREYHFWMREEVFGGFMRGIRDDIRKMRDIPVLYNNTGLLGRRQWRSRLYDLLDGFMFEHAETPEQKLFNIQLGRSTGKVIWTYVGSYGQYNREHIREKTIYGWLSYPVEGQELLLDGATGCAAGAGLKYWGLNRFYHMPQDPLEYESGRYVRDIFDFAQKHERLLASVRPSPQAGLVVGAQTIDWYERAGHLAQAYPNCYYGAFQLLKDNSYDVEPFLDYRMSEELLRRYRLVFAPNVPCLSDAQCLALRQYVEGGGFLVASHLTASADEFGRPRTGGGLSDLFGARLKSLDPVEVPDPYVRLLPSGDLIPQDPQLAVFEPIGGATVLAETLDRGRGRIVGPAVVSRRCGKGQVVYIGSSLEAIYAETLMRPLRDYIGSIVDPALAAFRTYELQFRPGCLGQFAASDTDLVLHLLANTGNKWKKLQVREAFVPVDKLAVRIRVPPGKTVRAVRLLRTGRVEWAVRRGWIELVIPSVSVWEVVHVAL